MIWLPLKFIIIAIIIIIIIITIILFFSKVTIGQFIWLNFFILSIF